MLIDIRAIHTDEDLDWALMEVERYFDSSPEPGSVEAERFDVLSALIEKYEGEKHPIEGPDPIELLEYAFTDMGRSQKQLGELLGSRSRASEIMSRKRPLTLDMIRTISAAWKLPIEVLAQPYFTEEERTKRPA